MKIVKFDQKLLICFTAKELATLLFAKNIPSIVDIAISYSQGQIKEEILTLAKTSSNSRDEHEFWVAIFGLYREFENNCQFCFFLKPKRASAYLKMIYQANDSSYMHKLYHNLP